MGALVSSESRSVYSNHKNTHPGKGTAMISGSVVSVPGGSGGMLTSP